MRVPRPARRQDWRKRVGVEPTRRPSRSGHAGFEDQEGRRAPCASAADSTGTPSATADRVFGSSDSAGHLLLLKLNRYEEAEGRLVEALLRVPNHAPALAAAAEIAARKGLWEPATRLAERSFGFVPEFSVATALVDYRHAMGDATGEERAKSTVKTLEALLPAGERSVHRLLALYLAEHGDARRAVEMTSRELKNRKDIGGYDAYAWCLYRAGRARDAAEPMAKALATGAIDPMFEFHAGAIPRLGRSPGGAHRLDARARDRPPLSRPLRRRGEEDEEGDGMRKSLFLLALSLLLSSADSFSHPMGNFSVNRWTWLSPRAGGIDVTHVIDLAEIPTQRALSELNLTSAPQGERSRNCGTPSPRASFRAWFSPSTALAWRSRSSGARWSSPRESRTFPPRA